jgi:hypothetical protein
MLLAARSCLTTAIEGKWRFRGGRLAQLVQSRAEVGETSNLDCSDALKRGRVGGHRASADE